MKNFTKYSVLSMLFVLISATPFAVAHAQYDMGYDYGGDSGYDMGYDYGGDYSSYDSYDMGYDYGGDSGYDMGYDYGSGSSYDMGYDYGDTSSYDMGYDYGDGNFSADSSGNFSEDCTYFCSGNFSADCTYDCAGNFSADDTFGNFSADSGNFSADAGNFSADYETCYDDCYSAQTSSSYTSQTPYYSSNCDCYASQPNYSASNASTYRASTMPTYAYNAIPTYAQQYIPSYVYAPTPSYPSRPQPTYAAVSTPAPTYNTNTNANTNSNVNMPTAVATATATNGDNINTNLASTGAITNTFAPVINVNGAERQRPAQYEFPRPVCTIYSSGSYNQNTLTWSSQNATTAYISPNVGNVPVNGARTVYTQGYTTYTLTVTGTGGSATCQTTANYAPSYTVAPTYPVASTPAPYVALSQIPYTGFDYGPVGNAIYWTAILAFAAAAGYLLVYGMPKFAFAGFARKEESTFSDSAVQEARLNDEVGQVFKSSIVPLSEIKETVNTFALPVATSSHAGLTSDAMIIDRSNGTPRIVIARA